MGSCLEVYVTVCADSTSQTVSNGSSEEAAADERLSYAKDFPDQPTTSASDASHEQPLALCNMEWDQAHSHCYAVSENSMFADSAG